jgi:hypothetical protein
MQKSPFLAVCSGPISRFSSLDGSADPSLAGSSEGRTHATLHTGKGIFGAKPPLWPSGRAKSGRVGGGVCEKWPSRRCIRYSQAGFVRPDGLDLVEQLPDRLAHRRLDFGFDDPRALSRHTIDWTFQKRLCKDGVFDQVLGTMRNCTP